MKWCEPRPGDLCKFGLEPGHFLLLSTSTNAQEHVRAPGQNMGAWKCLFASGQIVTRGFYYDDPQCWVVDDNEETHHDLACA